MYATYCDGAFGVPIPGVIHTDELDGVGLVIAILGEDQGGLSDGASAAPRISSGEYG